LVGVLGGSSYPAFSVCSATARGDDVSPVIAVVRALVRVARSAEHLKVTAHVEKMRIELAWLDVVYVQQWLASAKRKLATTSSTTMA